MIADDQVGQIQARLAYIYALGFFLALMVLIFFGRGLDEFSKSVLLTMLGYLGALVQQQSSYFFARQRPDTQPANTQRVITDQLQAAPPATEPLKPPAFLPMPDEPDLVTWLREVKNTPWPVDPAAQAALRAEFARRNG